MGVKRSWDGLATSSSPARIRYLHRLQLIASVAVQVVTAEEFARIPGAELHQKKNENTHHIDFLRGKLLEGFGKYGWRTSDGGDPAWFARLMLIDVT